MCLSKMFTHDHFMAIYDPEPLMQMVRAQVPYFERTSIPKIVQVVGTTCDPIKGTQTQFACFLCRCFHRSHIDLSNSFHKCFFQTFVHQMHLIVVKHRSITVPGFFGSLLNFGRLSGTRWKSTHMHKNQNAKFDKYMTRFSWKTFTILRYIYASC